MCSRANAAWRSGRPRRVQLVLEPNGLVHVRVGARLQVAHPALSALLRTPPHPAAPCRTLPHPAAPRRTLHTLCALCTLCPLQFVPQFLLHLCAEAPSVNLSDAIGGVPPPAPPQPPQPPVPAAPSQLPTVLKRQLSSASRVSQLSSASRVSHSSRVAPPLAEPPAVAVDTTPVHRVSLFSQRSQTPRATVDLFGDPVRTARDAD